MSSEKACPARDPFMGPSRLFLDRQALVRSAENIANLTSRIGLIQNEVVIKNLEEPLEPEAPKEL